MPNFLHKASGTLGDGSFWSFGLTTGGSITEAAAETAWGNAVVAFFSDTNVKAYYSASFLLSATSTSTASATFHQTTKTTTSHSVAGTSTGAQLPTVLSPVWSLYSGNATKDGRGRIYLPAPTTTVLGAVSSGHLDATVAGDIGTALATLWSSLNTAGLTPILYVRRTTRGGTPAYTTTDITSRKLQGKVHVQKRRGDKIIAPTYSA